MAQDSKDAFTEAVEGAAQLDDMLVVVNGTATQPWTRLELLLLLACNRLAWVEVEDGDDGREDWQR